MEGELGRTELHPLYDVIMAADHGGALAGQHFGVQIGTLPTEPSGEEVTWDAAGALRQLVQLMDGSERAVGAGVAEINLHLDAPGLSGSEMSCGRTTGEVLTGNEEPFLRFVD